MKYIYTFLLMVGFFTSGKGQNKTNQSDSVRLETNDATSFQGPKTITRTIKQDRKGNIWIAAFDGVFRCDDGKTFTNITGKVSSARFFSVLEDRKGNFWFASIGSGVYYYDGKSFRNFTTREGLASDRVAAIYEDKTGNIWFGTESGVSCYDGKSIRNYMLNGDAGPNPMQPGDSAFNGGTGNASLTKELSNKYDNDVNAIIEDKKGKFWFGTRGNVRVYDGQSFTILTHNGIPFTNVRTIIKDKKGHIWLGGKDGLWRYDGSTFTNFTLNFVGYIYEDKNGNIWTSSQNTIDQRWMLSRYDGKSLADQKPTVTEIQSKYENNKGMIFGIQEANDGIMWFGALDGVYRYDGNAIQAIR